MAQTSLLGSTVFILNWSDFAGQARLNATRFDLLNPGFYLDNLACEGQRYFLGVRDPVTVTRAGFWLFILLPVAWFRQARSAMHQPESHTCWLLTATVAFPVMLAVLIQRKTFGYLLSAIPLFALVLAKEAAHWLKVRPRAAGIALTLVLLQGGLGIIRLHSLAAQRPPPQMAYAAFQHAVPPGRVLGHPKYWLYLPDRDYRSFALPFMFFGSLEAPVLPSFTAALQTVAPRVILLDPTFRGELSNYSTPLRQAQSGQFWNYLRDHAARQIGEVTDQDGYMVEIYVLEP